MAWRWPPNSSASGSKPATGWCSRAAPRASRTRAAEGIDLVAELNVGLEQIAAHEGSLVEAVINPNSELVGHSVREINFRQRYRMVVLALHRQGRNVREQVESLPLATGDVLLMMGTDPAIDGLRNSPDLVLFDRARHPGKTKERMMPLVLGVIAAVVGLEAFDILPIQIGALLGCLVLCFSSCLTTKEAYDAIEWPVIFTIFGMLALGLALDRTGAASGVAHSVADGIAGHVPAEFRNLAILAALYLLTMVLTEILSNNAVAALMVPIALGLAHAVGCDPRPLRIAVTFAASAAFATPIGYQTNTYIYGVGGYRFADFLKIGVPLNLICFIVAMVVIPFVWKF